jgi:ABC-type uncharacterized transport system auxiliary subunit
MGKRIEGMTRGVIAWALVLAASLTACGHSAPVPSDTYYRLAPIASPQTRHLVDGTLVIDAFEAGVLYRERALLYSEDAANLTLKQYRYQHWEEAPPRLLQLHLQEFLRSAGAASNVTLRDNDNSAALHVHGRLFRFEHILGGDAVTARVGLELSLSDRNGHTLVQRQYQVDKPAQSRDVAAVVVATNQAVDEIFARFLDDAAQSVAGAAK